MMWISFECKMNVTSYSSRNPWPLSLLLQVFLLALASSWDGGCLCYVDSRKDILLFLLRILFTIIWKRVCMHLKVFDETSQSNLNVSVQALEVAFHSFAPGRFQDLWYLLFNLFQIRGHTMEQLSLKRSLCILLDLCPLDLVTQDNLQLFFGRHP